jgi:DNA-binding transcriptional regulator YiaG
MSAANALTVIPEDQPRANAGDEHSTQLEINAAHVADVNRFAGLAAEWFWVDEFRPPEPTCWAKENAAAVAKLRLKNWTHSKLSTHFRVSIPTIRHALTLAEAEFPELLQMPRKMPRKRWHEEHAEEVAALRNELTIKELAKHFGKSVTTILAALESAKRPDQAAEMGAAAQIDKTSTIVPNNGEAA